MSKSGGKGRSCPLGDAPVRRPNGSVEQWHLVGAHGDGYVLEASSASRLHDYETKEAQVGAEAKPSADWHCCCCQRPRYPYFGRHVLRTWP